MHPLDVLLVEDNVGDEFLIALIIGEAPVPVRLHVARDGVEALFRLAQHGVHPDLVILDLNLPPFRDMMFFDTTTQMMCLWLSLARPATKQIGDSHSKKVRVNLFRSPAASRTTSGLFWG
jgi:CheY-like chemotaxis protein